MRIPEEINKIKTARSKKFFDPAEAKIFDIIRNLPPTGGKNTVLLKVPVVLSDLPQEVAKFIGDYYPYDIGRDRFIIFSPHEIDLPEENYFVGPVAPEASEIEEGDMWFNLMDGRVYEGRRSGGFYKHCSGIDAAVSPRFIMDFDSGYIFGLIVDMEDTTWAHYFPTELKKIERFPKLSFRDFIRRAEIELS